MAVEQDVLIACAPRPSPEIDLEDGDHGHVQARNLHPKYTPQSFKPMLKPVCVFCFRVSTWH